MSKVRKAKKLRQPNIPLSAATPSVSASSVRVSESRAGAASEAPTVEFDYSQTKRDLTRIGLIAGGFIAVLIALTFFIR